MQQELVSMGFEESLVSVAISQCPGGSLDDVVSCILLLSGDSVEDNTTSHVAAAMPSESDPLKMVLVVRMDLGMSAGKVAAQCVHAALGGVRASDQSTVTAWRHTGEPVICLKCGSLEEMHGLRSAAAAANLRTYIVHDAGRTEVPGGSQTVLSIGPSTKSRIDQVTGNLKLY